MRAAIAIAATLLAGPLQAGTSTGNVPAAGAGVPADGNGGNAPQTLPTVVVAGDPVDASLPASLDWRDAGDIPAWPRARVSDLLRRIPGVEARDRQNLAQDLQLTVRGVGARTTFGMRGLRIYVDGIPATMPDGQGQLSHVPLSALGGVEVLRGPFSAMYGNAAGGVVRFWSRSPAPAAEATLSASAGGDARNVSLDASGPWRGGDRQGEGGDGGYRVDAERRAKASRTASPPSSRRTSARPSSTPGGRSAAARCATPSAPARATSSRASPPAAKRC